MQATVPCPPVAAPVAGSTPAYLYAVRRLALSLCALCSITGLNASPVEMTFDGVNGAAAFGYYVGKYFGTMDGAPVELYCVDFENEVTFGQRWDANLTPIVSGANLSGARF